MSAIEADFVTGSRCGEAGMQAGNWDAGVEKYTLVKSRVLEQCMNKPSHEQLCDCISHSD